MWFLDSWSRKEKCCPNLLDLDVCCLCCHSHLENLPPAHAASALPFFFFLLETESYLHKNKSTEAGTCLTILIMEVFQNLEWGWWIRPTHCSGSSAYLLWEGWWLQLLTQTRAFDMSYFLPTNSSFPLVAPKGSNAAWASQETGEFIGQYKMLPLNLHFATKYYCPMCP